MKTMEVNGSENIGDLGGRDVKLSEEFNLSTGDLRINPQLSRHCYKIFLKNLE